MGLDTYEVKPPNVRARMAILVGLMILVGVLLYTKQERPQQSTGPANAASVDAAAADNAEASLAAPAPDSTPSASIGAALPKLVDLGADKCVPCKMMAPVLEELKKTYAGKLDVVFIDVWKNPGEAEKYGVNVIPTQIFYDALGKERFRHEGFFAKEDILAKWKELGVNLSM